MRLFFILFGFLMGSLPLSVWLGAWILRKDIRHYGDGNPGATNVFRAGGWQWGLLAYCLEIGKAALPVGLAAQVMGIQDAWLVPIALAPSIGHAFSPWLNFRGGKALATMLGSWIGLTLWQAPLVILPALVIAFLLIRPEGWVVLLTCAVLAVWLAFFHPEAVLFAVLACQVVLIVYRHMPDFRQLPRRR
jgi:glycerol-3-phosphate acyltransferase PlsY